jgi:hypothetical protein
MNYLPEAGFHPDPPVLSPCLLGLQMQATCYALFLSSGFTDYIFVLSLKCCSISVSDKLVVRSRVLHKFSFVFSRKIFCSSSSLFFFLRGGGQGLAMYPRLASSSRPPALASQLLGLVETIGFWGGTGARVMRW